MFPLPLHIYFEIAALLVCIITWRSLSNTRLRWFLPFLVFIVAIEVTARYFTYEVRQPNAWLYCLSVPGEYIFYLFIFKNFYQRALFRKAGTWVMILFALYALYSIVFVTGLKFFDFNLLVAGSLAMIVFSLFYFIELYDISIQHPITQVPMFWIASGIFLFNAGEFSYNLLAVLIRSEAFDQTLKVFRSINNRLILVLYSTFIIAFLCQRIFGTYKKV